MSDIAFFVSLLQQECSLHKLQRNYSFWIQSFLPYRCQVAGMLPAHTLLSAIPYTSLWGHLRKYKGARCKYYDASWKARVVRVVPVCKLQIHPCFRPDWVVWDDRRNPRLLIWDAGKRPEMQLLLASHRQHLVQTCLLAIHGQKGIALIQLYDLQVIQHEKSDTFQKIDKHRPPTTKYTMHRPEHSMTCASAKSEIPNCSRLPHGLADLICQIQVCMTSVPRGSRATQTVWSQAKGLSSTELHAVLATRHAIFEWHTSQWLAAATRQADLCWDTECKAQSPAKSKLSKLMILVEAFALELVQVAQ